MANLVIDTSGLLAFGRSLASLSVEVGASAHAAVLESAEDVADKARELCTSDTVEATIHVEDHGGVEAAIAANGALAYLLEKGNVKGTKSATQFRHPLYGNTKFWYDQDMHPYLAPALKAKQTDILLKLALVMKTVSDEHLDGVYNAEGVKV